MIAVGRALGVGLGVVAQVDGVLLALRGPVAGRPDQLDRRTGCQGRLVAVRGLQVALEDPGAPFAGCHLGREEPRARLVRAPDRDRVALRVGGVAAHHGRLGLAVALAHDEVAADHGGARLARRSEAHRRPAVGLVKLQPATHRARSRVRQPQEPEPMR